MLQNAQKRFSAGKQNIYCGSLNALQSLKLLPNDKKVQ